MSRLKMMDSLKNSHTNLSDLEKYLPADLFQSYFKFAFVRNPWSWQVSLYEFGKQDTKHFQHELLNKFDFRDYISWRVENEVKFQTDFILNNKGDLGMNYLGKKGSAATTIPPPPPPRLSTTKSPPSSTNWKVGRNTWRWRCSVRLRWRMRRKPSSDAPP